MFGAALHESGHVHLAKLGCTAKTGRDRLIPDIVQRAHSTEGNTPKVPLAMPDFRPQSAELLFMPKALANPT
jgi:hypothetical protein